MLHFVELQTRLVVAQITEIQECNPFIASPPRCLPIPAPLNRLVLRQLWLGPVRRLRPAANTMLEAMTTIMDQ